LLRGDTFVDLLLDRRGTVEVGLREQRSWHKQH
jgi:hypothetical protein